MSEISLGTLAVLTLLCGLVSWVSIRQLIQFLIRRNMLDQPNERTLHNGAVPRGGGITIAASLVTACLLAALLTQRFVFFGGLLLLMSAWALLSWRDDQVDLSPRFRLLAQFLIAVATVLAFGWVNSVEGIYLGWFGAVISVVGVLWMANLYNFMDGMDGLAASQTIIACITLAFWFYMAGNNGLTLICMLVAASSYAFLLWNWHPARIFMGDVGSVTLGAFFATLIIVAANRHGFPVLSLVLIFTVFVADATITLGRRAWRREKIWLPHRTHYYQRLATLGFSHTRIVCVAITMMLLCSVIATLTVLYRDIIPAATLGVIALVSLVAAYVTWLEAKQS